MSYLAEAEQLGTALAELVARPVMILDERSVQAALTARHALLGLIAVQLAEAVPLDRRVTRADLHTIGEHPVAGLIGVIREHPRPHSEIAPSALYVTPPDFPDGQLWLEVARRATLAQAEWEGRDQPLNRLHEWTVVREAAAMASALASLDGRLVGAAVDAGCHDQVLSMTAESRLLLQTAAREASALAAEGHLEPLPDRFRRSRPIPIPVRYRVDVVPALVTLRAILTHSPVLTPEHARLVVIALARVAHVVEGSAPDRGPATLTASLRRAAAAPAWVASPFAGDRRAVIQAGEVSRWAQTKRLGGRGGDSATIEHAKKCLAALDGVVQRQLRTGLWFVPEPDPDSAFAWRVWNMTQPLPGLASAIRQASVLHPPEPDQEPSLSRRSDGVLPHMRPGAPQSRPARARL